MATNGKDDIIISVRGLKTQFGSQVVHDNLDLDVRRGEIIGVVGASGSGKSRLLRAMRRPLQTAAGRGELFRQRTERPGGWAPRTRGRH